MTQIENHDGNDYVVQANVGYDGLGNRVLGTTVVEGVPMTVTYTLDGILGQPLMIANNLETTLILYGKYGLGEYKLNAPAGEQWQFYLGDGQLSVRQLTDGDGNVTLTRTYGPYGVTLAQAGNGSALFGYAGAQSGAGGLWYFGNGYFDPQTGQFLATGGNPLAPLAANVLANPGSLLFGPLMLINWRRRKKKRLHPATLLFFGVVLAVALTACQDGDPIATQAPETTPEVTGAPAPTQPGNPTATPPSEGTGNSIEVPLIVCPEPGETTDSAPPLETPPVDTTPNPTEPPTEAPTPTVDPMGTPFRDPETGLPVLPSLIASFSDHPIGDGPGNDLVPETRRNNNARGFIVVALRGGLATNNQPEFGVGPNMVAIKPKDIATEGSYEIMYSHIDPSPEVANRLGVEVEAGQVIGTIMDISNENFAAVRSPVDHLHLGYREPVGGSYIDSSFLIPVWGTEGLIQN